EDGIRDRNVTGVQTCALPICMTAHYYMGSGHHGAEPDINSVVSSLTLDGSGYWNAQGFSDWASEYGYETGDPEKMKEARRIYRRSEERRVGKEGIARWGRLHL